MKKNNLAFFVFKNAIIASVLRPNILILGLFLIFASSNLNSQNLSLALANTFGGPSDDTQNSICLDSCGNVYVTGIFSGVVDFDPSASVYTLSTGSQQRNAYVAKYGALGNLIWIKQFQCQQWDFAQSIKLDKNGNIGFTGCFNDIADIDPSSNVLSIGSSSETGQYAYVKLDPVGNLIFGFTLGAGLADAASVNFDQNGDLIITGCFYNVLDLDVGPGTKSVVSVNGSSDFFICKYSASGNFVWGENIGGPGLDRIFNIAFDNVGDILATGKFANTVDFDPSASTFTISSTTGEMYILKLTSNGNFVWVKNIGGSSVSNYCNSICTDNNNNIYLAGQITSTVDVDPSAAIFTLSSNGASDCFIEKLSPAGAFIWAKQIGGPGYDNSSCLKLGANNHIYVSGCFQQSVDFDPGAPSFILSSSSFFDGFFLELDNSANFLSALQFAGGSSTAIARPMEFGLHESGSVFLGGYFVGTVDFDPSSVVMNKTSLGGYDAFFLKLSPCIDAPAWNCQPLNNCSGSSATLVANGGANLNWYTSTSSVNISTGPSFITPTLATGSYTYYAEASTCTLTNNRAVFVVTVSPSPTVIINPPSGSVCSGDKVAFYAIGANNYYWNGSNFPQSPSFTAVVTSNTVYSVVGISTLSSCSGMKTASLTVNICTGIENLTNEIELKIFPSPCVDVLFIQSALPLTGALYDSVGKIVLNFELKAGLSNLSIVDLNPGIYLMKVNGLENNLNHKIVKAFN